MARDPGEGGTRTVVLWPTGDGLAVLDIEGGRHALPGIVVELVRRDNPIELFAVDGGDRVVARLPSAGLSDEALSRFAARAGLAFVHEINGGWGAMVDAYPPSARSILRYEPLSHGTRTG